MESILCLRGRSLANLSVGQDSKDADDRAIWDHAEANGLVLLTKDEDFAMRTQLTQAVPVIVWLRVGNSSNQALRAWLEPRLPGIIQLVMQGSRLVEVI